MKFFKLFAKVFFITLFLSFVYFAKKDLTVPIFAQAGTTITVNPAVTYQTMLGWEATAQAGQTDCSEFNNYKNQLYDESVNDLGITRLRLEVKTGTDPLAFNTIAFDDKMNRVILPIKNRVEANGEKFFLNVNFVGASSFPSDVSIYASEVVKLYQHMQQAYGFLPDSFELALEPTYVTPGWTQQVMVDAVIATGDALKAAGFGSNIYFVLPSKNGGALDSIKYFDNPDPNVNGDMIDLLSKKTLAEQSRFFSYFKEFSYHRYGGTGGTDPYLDQVNNIRNTYNVDTSQLEHGGATYTELHVDLKYGKVSAWQQYTLGFCTTDNGYQYYTTSTSVPTIGNRTKYLRQYFKYIRPGAVMIDSSTTNTAFDPLTFVNANGSYVVVVKATTAGTFNIAGLPASTYGIMYTTGTGAGQWGVNAADQTIASGQNITTNISKAGVITIYGKTGGAPIPTPSVILARVSTNPTSINTIVNAASWTTGISALAYDSNNNPIWSGVYYEWGISSTNSIGTLTRIYSDITEFVPQNAGTGDIFVTARLSGQSVTFGIPVVVNSQPTPIPSKLGDVNGDGHVNISDLGILLSNFGTSSSAGDVNGDGNVNISDLGILLSNFGT